MQRLVSFLALTLLAGSGFAGDVTTISAAALHERLKADAAKPLVVDVREPEEFASGHIAGARPAPLGEVEQHLANVPKDREIVLVCQSGRRSGLACKRLAEQGFTRLSNMEDGMLAWKKLGYPVEKK